MRPIAALALAAIRFYQRVVSPYKGFSCALRVATGGASCSAYGHAVIARYGLSRGLGLLQRRFELCGHVYLRTHACPPPHPRLKYQRGFCDAPCDLPCDGHGHCVSADTVADAVSCAADAGDCGSSRNGRRHRERPRSSEQLDAAAERIRRREARSREENLSRRSAHCSSGSTGNCGCPACRSR